MSSPTLLNIYLKELIAEIRVSNKGSRLGCLAYEDDVVLMADRKEHMEEILQVTTLFGKEWQLRLNSRKCKVIQINDDRAGDG